ncbi:MAG TPA: hypothetical protein VNG90_02390 [Candidatus Acidoferrum sp.]|nr:hypothetical protein [Candidatus Acidoferrum sp.]
MFRQARISHLPGTVLRHASLSDVKNEALSRRDLVRLAASPRECTIRVTGGAALMGDSQGLNVGRFLAEALGGPNCDAAVLAGATMAIDRPLPGLCPVCDTFNVHCPAHGYGLTKPKPGVMEVLMCLADMKAPARTIGLVPTINDLTLYGGFLMVENNPQDPYYTVVDNRCPICLMLQFSTDKPRLTWDDEWRISLDYMELLRNEAQHRSLHIAFNGGGVTDRECRHIAALPSGDNPWNLLLVEDSGRTAQALANDMEFRREFTHVVSCPKHELATVISQMGFSPSMNEGDHDKKPTPNLW